MHPSHFISLLQQNEDYGGLRKYIFFHDGKRDKNKKFWSRHERRHGGGL